MKSMKEVVVGLCQRKGKYYTKDCFVFYSWFSSKRSDADLTDIGSDFIGLVKTKTKGFCNNTINNMKKYCPGGSCLVFKNNPMVPGYSPLLAIGYKYNS